MTAKVIAITNDIILYNWMSLLFGVPIILAAGSVDQNGDSLRCKAIFGLTVIVHNSSNFLLYRVLISKSQLVDAMGQHKSLANKLWWFNHCFFLPFVVLVYFLGDRQLRRAAGRDKQCTDDPPTAILIIFFFIDTVYSALCLALFVMPMRAISDESSEALNKRRIIRRNAVIAFIAIVSTAMHFVFAISMAGTVHTLLGEVFCTTIAFDVFVNMCCVNLMWDFTYYNNALGGALSKILSSVFPGGSQAGGSLAGPQSSKGSRPTGIRQKLSAHARGHTSQGSLELKSLTNVSEGPASPRAGGGGAPLVGRARDSKYRAVDQNV